MTKPSRFALLFAAALAMPFAGCTSEGGDALAGNWTEQTADGEAGLGITFDGKDDRISVHLPTREDGTHGHAEGELTYDFDPDTKKVVVRAELLGPDGPTEWTGAFAGDHFTLEADGTSRKFVRGNRHGH